MPEYDPFFSPPGTLQRVVIGVRNITRLNAIIARSAANVIPIFSFSAANSVCSLLHRCLGSRWEQIHRCESVSLPSLQKLRTMIHWRERYWRQSKEIAHRSQTRELIAFQEICGYVPVPGHCWLLLTVLSSSVYTRSSLEIPPRLGAPWNKLNSLFFTLSILGLLSTWSKQSLQT